MTLSLEQFKALRAKGLSTEQIVKFDTQENKSTSPIQPALDVAGTAIGIGGQALKAGYEALPERDRGVLDLAGKAVGAVGKGYNWLKDKYLESPLNVVRDIVSKVLSDKPIIEGNLPIKNLKGGKLETVSNIPISESPQSILKHIQSLGIDLALGGGAKGKIDEFNDPANMLTRASKSQSKAEKLTAEILQPKTGEMDDVIKYSMPEITKTKDYGKLAESLGSSRDSVARARNALLSSSKAQVGEEYLEPILDLYKTMSKDPQLAKKAGPLADAIYAEYEYLFSKKGRKISLMEAQQRKENLQTLTKPILESGGADISDPVLKQAWDKIRYGFKSSMEDAVPGLREKNAPYGGLKEGADLASVQRDLALKGTKENIFQRFSHIIRPYPQGSAAALAREAINRETSLSGKTGSVQKHYKKAQTLRELAGKKIRGEK